MAISIQGQKAVFLDKDGTLLENEPYNVSPSLVRLAPRAGQALRLLEEAGYLLVVVSNQSGIARGLFQESAIEPLRRHLENLFIANGVSLAGFFYCPHHPEGKVPMYSLACTCRKPAPGLLRAAGAELGIDLRNSWIVGDILDDVEAGNRALCRTILLDNGGETEWQMDAVRRPHWVVADIYEAAWTVLSQTEMAVPVGGAG